MLDAYWLGFVNGVAVTASLGSVAMSAYTWRCSSLFREASQALAYARQKLQEAEKLLDEAQAINRLAAEINRPIALLDGQGIPISPLLEAISDKGSQDSTFGVMGLTQMNYEPVRLLDVHGRLLTVQQAGKVAGQIGTVVIEQVHPNDLPRVQALIARHPGSRDQLEFEDGTPV